MRKNIYVMAILLLCLGLALSGCAEEDGDENGNGNAADDIEEASSLKFTVEGTTAEGDHGILTWSAKDIGTEAMKMRAEGTSNGEEFGYILNGVTKTIYALEDGVWEKHEFGDDYWDMMWDSYETMFQSYHTALTGWTGGEYTYTDGEGNQARIYEIQVNPSLDDSLFNP